MHREQELYGDAMDYDRDDPDPCEVCGGNYMGVSCATLCDGCEGCPVTGAPCHECTCPPPHPDEFEERCGKCGGWESQCAKDPAACEAEARRNHEFMWGPSGTY